MYHLLLLDAGKERKCLLQREMGGQIVKVDGEGDKFKKCTTASRREKIGILTETLLRSIFSRLGKRLGMIRTSS